MGQKEFAVERHIYVSSSHTKFGWISSNGLGGDIITDRPTEGHMHGQGDGLMDGGTNGWRR